MLVLLAEAARLTPEEVEARRLRRQERVGRSRSSSTFLVDSEEFDLAGRRESSAVRRFVAFQATGSFVCRLSLSGVAPPPKMPATPCACPVFTRFLSAFVRGFQWVLRPIKLTLVVVVAWTATQLSLNHGWASRARRRPCLRDA